MENGIQEVDFIVDMDGNLKIGKGHSYLANGKSVQVAGTIKVNSQGYVRNITNESGHYQPTVSQAQNYQQILENVGLNVENTWIRIGEFEASFSNYVIDKKYFIMVQSSTCQNRGFHMERITEMNKEIFRINLLKTIEEINDEKDLKINQLKFKIVAIQEPGKPLTARDDQMRCGL